MGVELSRLGRVHPGRVGHKVRGRGENERFGHVFPEDEKGPAAVPRPHARAVALVAPVPRPALPRLE